MGLYAVCPRHPAHAPFSTVVSPPSMAVWISSHLRKKWGSGEPQLLSQIAADNAGEKIPFHRSPI